MRGDPLVKCATCSDFDHMPRVGVLPVSRLCATCLFWRERQEAMSHPLAIADVRFNHALYVLDTYGEDGLDVHIRYLHGGHLRTRRLRFVMRIPDHLRAVLPDNAVVEIIK